jgi:protoporphyrinogen/coproporphyrinogen III oxidase
VRLAAGETLDADAVVVALPAHAAARLLADASPELARLLGEVEHVSPATVSLAYRAADVPRALDGTGYVIPRAEGREALACTFASSKFLGRAPAGEALFRVFLGGAGRPDVLARPDEALVAAARRELAEMVGVTAEPIDALVTRWPRALPQYHLGHLARVERIERLEAGLPGLALAGNAYRGVGIPDCVRSAERAARAVTDYLSGARLSALGPRR